MIKHSENTSEPHDKFVYLSKDERFLCWKSIDRENEKRMEITDIEKVVTEGSQCLIKDSKINDINRCFVIVSE